MYDEDNSGKMEIEELFEIVAMFYDLEGESR